MAAPIIDGLASNMQWYELVEKLHSANYRQFIEPMNSELETASKERTALSELKTNFTALKTAVGELDTDSEFLVRETSVSVDTSATDEDPSVSATASAGTLIGDYTFEITQLATATAMVGSSDVATQINPDTDVSSLTLSSIPLATAITTGYFHVNGNMVTIDSTSDSLQDIFDAISTATSSAVTGSYDDANDTITLTSTSDITLGSGGDTSNFLAATKLFTQDPITTTISSNSALGTVKLSSALSSANLATSPSSSGSFSVNGVSISYDSSTDTAYDIMNAINTSDAEARLTYDSVNDQFTLTNNQEGAVDVVISDDSENLLAALGLTTSSTVGKVAKYKINGGSELESNGNTIDSTSHGITGLAITAIKTNETDMPDTVTVSQDTDTVRTKIEDFIEKYNDVQAFIDDNTKVSEVDDGYGGTVFEKGDLAYGSRREIVALGIEMRNMVFAAVDSLASGTIKRLHDIGIDFESDPSGGNYVTSNYLEVSDSDALDDALRDNSDTVADLFNDDTDGFNTNLKAFLDINLDLTSAESIIKSSTESIKALNERLNKSIDKKTRSLNLERERMLKDFARLEEAQQDSKMQLQGLKAAFPNHVTT